MRSHRHLALLASSCLLLAGCVTRSASDKSVSFHYQWWLPIGLFLAGVLFVPLSLLMRRRSGRFGWGLILVGPIAALAFAPSLLMERVVVDDRGFTVRSGIWGMTANHSIQFDQVRECRVTQEQTSGRAVRFVDVLYFDLKTGPAVRLPLNNDVKVEAGKEIVARAAQHGVAFSGPR